MSQSEDEGDKPYDATPRKLEEARRRGEVPKSNDLIAAGAYGGFFLAAAVFGTTSLQKFGETLSILIDRSATLAPALLADGGSGLAGGLMMGLFAASAPWLMLPAGVAILAILAQRSFVASGSKLEPKLSRISPLENFKNKFGRNGLFEFVKSTVKLIVIAAVLAAYLAYRWPDLMQTMALEARSASAVMMQLSVEFLGAVICIGATIGIVDYAWQYAEHMRKNRMSHQELMDEMKQSEGDPHFKQERRQRGMEIAANRMLADVPTADVVIVNPEHYAVALSWDRSPGSAPVCVAKGVDHMALQIKEIARENEIPIHSDPPTARALHATTDLGEQIAPEYYRAVAAAIRFAEKMRLAARERYGK